VRRDFLKTLSAGVGGLLVGVPTSGGCRPSRTDGGDALFEAFRSPSAEARPFFRWWWNGNRVTRDELIRELQVMHAVGAGGVEINPIGMHEAVADPSGRAIEWLSDEWTRLEDMDGGVEERTLAAVLRADAKRLTRDPFLLFMVGYPWLITWALRELLPTLNGRFADQLTLSDYYPVAACLVALLIPNAMGIVLGLQLLEEKDEGSLVAVAVTPMSLDQYFLYRTVVYALVSAALLYRLFRRRAMAG
jgi:hypothetical protein